MVIMVGIRTMLTNPPNVAFARLDTFNPFGGTGDEVVRFHYSYTVVP